MVTGVEGEFYICDKRRGDPSGVSKGSRPTTTVAVLQARRWPVGLQVDGVGGFVEELRSDLGPGIRMHPTHVPETPCRMQDLAAM